MRPSGTKASSAFQTSLRSHEDLRVELCQQTAFDLARQIRARTLTARELTDACLARIAAFDDRIGAFLHVDADQARAAADDVDRRLAAGEPVGALAGIPVAVKDNIAIAHQPCTCAGRRREDFRPPCNAHVVEQLRRADAILLGKTNLDEFAMGSSTENSGLQETRNPWDTTRVPGGSSGGSAAAVAAGFAPLALGTDTGGSIRQPASFCGCVGMKPTYGLVSRYGLVAFGSSLDQIGPFARTAADAALLLTAIAGPDPRDATCRRTAPEDLQADLDRGVEGLRLGLPREYFDTRGPDPQVRDAVLQAAEVLRAAGAEVREISLPLLDYATTAYYIIATAEASSNLARYDGVHYGHRAAAADDIITLFSRSRREGFGAEVKRRILLGTYVLSAGYYDAYYLRALRVRTRIAEDFARAFTGVDLILNPSCPTTAFRLAAKTADLVTTSPSEIYTISTNLAALPAISLPCGRDAAGLPIGLQITAPRWEDARALRVAAAYERASRIAAAIAPLGCK